MPRSSSAPPIPTTTSPRSEKRLRPYQARRPPTTVEATRSGVPTLMRGGSGCRPLSPCSRERGVVIVIAEPPADDRKFTGQGGAAAKGVPRRRLVDLHAVGCGTGGARGGVNLCQRVRLSRHLVF